MSHNLEIVTDANGTETTSTYDPKNRLTARAVTTAAAGIVGPLAESYAYDSLDRAVTATSGSVTTSLTYDSASRQLTDTTLGRTVAYGYDKVHNRIKTTYPSGHVVDVAVDGLDRPDTVSIAGVPTPAVDYGYRGPWLRQKATYGNGLAGSVSFDGTWRPTASLVADPASRHAAFIEVLAWNPRSLKTSIGRGDAGGRGFVLEHDGAQRVTQAVTSGAAALTTNNSVPALPASPPQAFGYTYDAAQNLLAHSMAEGGDAEIFATPNDASGRNRPGSAGGAALGYDANGNRAADSGRQLRYDFRNRLTEVRDAGGALIASYTYDAFNRRVRKDVVGQPAEEMVYAGWQELERYTAGTLDQRYTRGTGIDEIVRMEADVDANGSLETAWTPIYDHTGNLTMLTGGAGEVVARYDYSPFGEAFTAHSDLVAPAVELIAADPENLLMILNLDLEALLDEAPVLEDTSPPAQSLGLPGAKVAGILSRSISRPVSEGPVAGRRFEITLDVAPAEGTPLRLTIPADSLVDRFGNPLAADLVVDFTWPAVASGIQVLLDTAPPEIERVRLDQGFVEVTFSEPPAAGAFSAITINQVVPNQVIAMTWTEQVDGHTLRGDTALAAGSYLLAVDGVTAIDLAGKPLATSFELGLEVGLPLGVSVAFEQAEPTVVPPAAFVNRFAFHGRPVDLETGLVYFRNRYFDPKTGRFISADPMGYVDGPSIYQGFGNSPLNYADPLGLRRVVVDAAPWDPEALRIQRLYEEAWLEFKSTSIGAEIADRLENDPRFTLYIRFDPNYDSGLVVRNYIYDRHKHAVMADVIVGSKFPAAPTSPAKYPFGASLFRRDEVGVYTVAHEEAGHFLRSVDDPLYNMVKFFGQRLVDQKLARLEAERARLRTEIENSSRSERRKRRMLNNIDTLLAWWANEDLEMIRLRQAVIDLKKYIELEADAVGKEVVLEYREN